ncbi:MAG: class I SAM-dependent methyltransferase [Opitutales bacterium]|nr:class I SAM-dependent methyltransferase [Opitutales bacterium]
MTVPAITVETSAWAAYELVDSGDGRKLERFGDHLLVRSEPKAWWRPRLEADAWSRADAVFEDSGRWITGNRNLAKAWTLRLDKLRLEARLTDMSKHVGVFPEQEPHWRWLHTELSTLRRENPPEVLNLFGYTGVATLVAAAAGARVTHVDASKPALAWARENQERSGLANAPVRWLLDDAFKFVAREIRRGRRYDAILLDPPSFGRGPKGEIWKVESQIADLMEHLRSLLDPARGRLVLTLYNLEASALMLANLVRSKFSPGTLTCGELALRGTAPDAPALPLSLFARWKGPQA